MVKLDFKFNLLGARILGIGIGVLAGDALLLQVLILYLDSDEELDAALVFLLVARDEGRLLARWIDAAGGLRPCILLLVHVAGGLLGDSSAAIVLWVSLLIEWFALAGHFALFIGVGQVTCRLNLK